MTLLDANLVLQHVGRYDDECRLLPLRPGWCLCWQSSRRSIHTNSRALETSPELWQQMILDEAGIPRGGNSRDGMGGVQVFD